MHLFPEPYAGLHPAFPRKASWITGHPALNYAGLPSLAYLVPAVASTISGRPVGWVLASNVAAYGLLATTAYGCVARTLVQKRAEAFLREQNIEIPKGKLLDRLGYFDIDDAVILGAAAGVTIASRHRRPRSVIGWKRWAAATSVGVCGGGLLFILKVAFTATVNKEKEAELNESVAQRKEAMKWRGPVNLAWRKANNKVPNPSTGPKTAAMPPLGSTMTGSLELPGQSKSQSQPRKSVPPGEKIGFDIGSWPNLTNEPHLTLSDSPGSEPVPYADTNYLWSPSPGRAIPELEAHISKLRHQRDKIANEAEYLWRWLARKEAEYYNFKETSSESEEKVKLRRYLEILGNAQTKVWLEVSRLDWMIANSQKRMEQLRSADKDGSVTWLPPPLSAAASATEHQMSQEILQGFHKLTQGRKKLIEQARTDVSRELADPEVKLDEAMVQDENGEWKNAREVGEKLFERLKLDWINAVLDEEVAAKVKEDGEQRAKEMGNQGG